MSIQVQASENPVLGEEVVAHHDRAKEIRLKQLLLLSKARQQEEQLRLERVLLSIRIEPGQKWVFLDHLEDGTASEALAEQLSETGLPNPDRLLDHDVTVFHQLAYSSLTRSEETIGPAGRRIQSRSVLRFHADRPGLTER